MENRLLSWFRAAWLAFGALILASAVQLAVPANAEAYVSGASWVVHFGSGLCMDDPGWSTSQGTRLQLYPCTGNANQLWRENIYSVCPLFSCPSGLGTIGVAEIQNVYSGLCLNISGGYFRNGAAAIQWGCIPGAANEQFWIRPTPQGPPNWSVYDPRTGGCLDDPYNSGATYTKLQFYQCNLTAAQIWVGAQWVGVD